MEDLGCAVDSQGIVAMLEWEIENAQWITMYFLLTPIFNCNGNNLQSRKV